MPDHGRIKRQNNAQPQQSAQCDSVVLNGSPSEQELLRFERLVREAVIAECGYERGDFAVCSFRNPFRLKVRLFTSYFNRNVEMDSPKVNPTEYDQKKLKLEKATLVNLRAGTDVDGLPIKLLEFERDDNAVRYVSVGQRCIKIIIDVPSLQDERTRERRARYAISDPDPTDRQR